MTWFHPRVGRSIGIAASVASLIVLSMLVPGDAAESRPSARAAAPQKDFIRACPSGEALTTPWAI